MFWLVKENHIMYKPPDAVFVEMSLSLRALVQETCIQKEMIFADFFYRIFFQTQFKRLFMCIYANVSAQLQMDDFFWIPHDLDNHFPRKLPNWIPHDFDQQGRL